jgi:hypothetical protein
VCPKGETMTLGLLYGSGDNAMWFILGFLACVVCFVALGFLDMATEEWKKFKEYKKQKPKKPTNEVIDVPFVVKPRTQLNSSQALVTRSTRVERRRDERQ